VNGFPILSAMAFLPLVGALVIFFAPKAEGGFARTVALAAATGSLLLSIAMVLRFDPNAPFEAGQAVPFQEKVEWSSALGVSYFLGVDGIAVPLIVLTTALTLIGIVWSWDTVRTRQREYYIALMLLETGMLGVFMALDLFVFYIFWELVLIPMALIIGIWGSANRVYAAVKFFLFTLFGSLLMLVGIVATYQAYFNETGVRTLNVLELQNGNYAPVFQGVAFAAFFIAFAVKVPLFPFHTWLPDAHVEAPTAASVILAAVMLKMGGYGMLRFNLPLYEDGTRGWSLPIILLSVAAILYGAFVALVQPDMKKLIAYSSVSHMGFVTLGIFILNMQGMQGSMMVMLAHGFNTGALFLLVGVIYERAHTRLISAFGGLAGKMPAYSAYFVLFMFASIGLPGLSGFVGEFLVALGTWRYNPLLAAFTFAVVIFAAWYMMWMTQRVVFGRAKDELPDPHDNALTAEDRALLAAAGGGHGHGHGHDAGHGGAHAVPLPVSGGGHGHSAAAGRNVGGEEHQPSQAADHAADPAHDEDHGANWPDLSRKEVITLFPLAVATIVFGIFPAPVLNLVEPAFARILAMYQ
jgi:NADH-quinone oxidoreductase subunit M